MASIFWDAHGILFIDYLLKGKTINSDYYMALLDRLSAEIKKKLPHMQKKKVLFNQANAPCLKSMKTLTQVYICISNIFTYLIKKCARYPRTFLEIRNVEKEAGCKAKTFYPSKVQLSQ